VGIGPPNLACALAQRTVAPDLVLLYEAGVVGARPERLPLSVGDPTLVTGALQVMGMWELFAHHLQRGLVDVAFLAGAQIDRRGNLNTTVVGDYRSPKIRLPGSGGACEIALNAGKTFILMPQSPRSFVGELDFVTSPGHPVPGQGGGPAFVTTQLGQYRFEDGEMVLTHLHPGVTLEQVRENTGWELAVDDDLEVTAPPTQRELAVLHTELDPGGMYTR
jgi:glutaconate CoA-transferase subunit B